MYVSGLTYTIRLSGLTCTIRLSGLTYTIQSGRSTTYFVQSNAHNGLFTPTAALA